MGPYANYDSRREKVKPNQGNFFSCPVRQFRTGVFHSYIATFFSYHELNLNIKSPVTGQPMANYAGRTPFYEEKALGKSTEEANEDFKILSDAAQEKKMKREKEKQTK